jgi:hypothetical protein
VSRRVATVLASAALLVAASAAAAADPLRLRSDVFTSAEPPVGLLILEGKDKEVSWLEAEALLWVAADDDPRRGAGDALVIAVHLIDPAGRGEARLGRFVLSTGAVRPVHLDGALVTGHAPWGSNLELFGGVPVVPRFGDRAGSWLVGSRASHRLPGLGTAGVSFVHRGELGNLADEEVGIDAAATPLPALDVAARAAYDLVYPGIADAQLSAAWRQGKHRLEAFAGHRSPSRLLPATSLFAALGDLSSDRAGAAILWRAAPRLDVRASAAAISAGDEYGAELIGRATLRLDDRGAGAVTLEGHRQGAGAGGWTGVRASARVPLTDALTASPEVEVAVPDESNGRGAVWPWALAALTWHRPDSAWDAAAAAEIYASPSSRLASTVLVRLSRRWGHE